jgi:hypothetical protein
LELRRWSFATAILEGAAVVGGTCFVIAFVVTCVTDFDMEFHLQS